MKRTLLALLVAFSPTLALCQATWTAKADLPSARSRAAAFEAGGKVYVGLGNANFNALLSDFASYDPATNRWSAVASFPASGRVDAAAVTLDGVGYVGLGRTIGGSATNFTDWYAFDPAANTWAAKASIPAGPGGGFAFAIDGKAYAGGGTSSQFYEYDPATDQWTSKAAFPGANRTLYCTFSVNGVGYVVGGTAAGSVGGVTSQVWAYDPATNQWTAKARFPFSVGISAAAGFAMGGFGYIVSGYDAPENPTTRNNDLYAYDPTANTWTNLGTTPLNSRISPVAVAVDDTFYVGSGSIAQQGVQASWWAGTGLLTSARPNQGAVWQVWPNPAQGTLTMKGLIGEARLVGMDGRVVKAIAAGSVQVDLAGVAPGLYVLEGKGPTGVVRERVVVQ